MATTIRGVDYYYVTVKDSLGAGYRLLADLAKKGVNFVAFNAVPLGPTTVQMALFPDKSEKLIEAAASDGLALTGPQRAILVQGDDQLGALAEIHRKLYDAKIDIYASSGVVGGGGSFGYVLYVKPDDFESAVRTLER